MGRRTDFLLVLLEVAVAVDSELPLLICFCAQLQGARVEICSEQGAQVLCVSDLVSPQLSHSWVHAQLAAGSGHVQQRQKCLHRNAAEVAVVRQEDGLRTHLGLLNAAGPCPPGFRPDSGPRGRASHIQEGPHELRLRGRAQVLEGIVSAADDVRPHALRGLLLLDSLHPFAQ